MVSFDAWLEALAARHLKSLQLRDVRRGIQALSSLYVERRTRIEDALSSAGKRAAFALYYSPLHFLAVREIVLQLGAHRDPAPAAILDLGCGTGVAASAWALVTDPAPGVTGVDSHLWAIEEARWNYRALDVNGKARRGSLERVSLEGWPAIIAAHAVNELNPAARTELLRRLLGAGRAGTRVLVVEPVARRGIPWWEEWSHAFRDLGGREDTWRFQVSLPEPLRTLDKASGLDHRELTARSVYFKGGNL